MGRVVTLRRRPRTHLATPRASAARAMLADGLADRVGTRDVLGLDVTEVPRAA